MKKQKVTESKPNKLVLPIFAALCALFGCGAIIGFTVLSSPTLAWRLFTALLPGYAICFAFLFLLVLGYGSIYPPIAYLTLPVSCLICGVRTTFVSAPYFSPLIIALVFALLCAASVAASMWALHAFPATQGKSGKKIPTAALAIVGTCLAATLSLGLFIFIFSNRLQSLQTENTAQATIGQMLYFMQHSGQIFTTLAAGAPQSYFLTQFSPLWYLILPVYILSKHSLLAVGIALYALMLSALVPLWRICRRHALTPWQTAAICAACALCPLILGGASSGGTLAMLSLPLLLWVADALESKRPYLALIPLALCLCIGFEVTVWTTFVCLYLALGAPRSQRRAHLVCTGTSAVALAATAVYLAIVKSPVLTGLFSGIGWQIDTKLLFIMLLLVPFALLPLLSRQKAALVLLFPLVLFHFIANAHTYSGVFCTYAFPAVAAVVLLSVNGVAKLHTEYKGVSFARLLPAAALCFAILLATPYVAVLTDLYATPTEQEKTDAARMQDLLDALPENAAITASDSLLAALHDRTWLFSLGANPEHPDTNVIVLDLREDFVPTDMEQYTVSYYESLGYTLRDDLSRDGILAVLFK